MMATKIATPEISLNAQGFAFLRLPVRVMAYPQRCFKQRIPGYAVSRHKIGSYIFTAMKTSTTNKEYIFKH
jgi:hypothetical protein